MVEFSDHDTPNASQIVEGLLSGEVRERVDLQLDKDVVISDLELRRQ